MINTKEAREYLSRSLEWKEEDFNVAMERIKRRLDGYKWQSNNSLFAELQGAIDTADRHRTEMIRISAKLEVLDALEREEG